MAQVNKMEYDELTLMQFVDGELDQTVAAEIEKSQLDDKELRLRIEVFKTTRRALISIKKSEEIPRHIHNLIDNFVPSKKQNLISRFVSNNPYKTSIISAILASIVTLQGAISVLVGSGTAITATQLATRGINIGPDNNMLLSKVNNSDSEFYRTGKNIISEGDLIEEQWLDALSSSSEMKQMVIELHNRSAELIIVSDFVNKHNKPCKLAQMNGHYWLACLDNKRWSLIFPK